MDWGISRGFSLLCSIVITTSCLVKENQEGVHLDCRFNGMTSLNGQPTGKGASVDLSHSGISAPPDSPETGLVDSKFTNLSYNLLKTLIENAFLGLQQLQTLDLSHNRVSAIQNKTFVGLTSLRTLRLGFNRLREVMAEVFYGLDQLTTLQLNHNELSVIENNTFDGLTSLQRLNLQSNTILTLEVQAFKGLSALTVLDLSGNKLRYKHSSLPERVFAALRSLQELYIQDNNQDGIGDYPTNVFNDLAALKRLSIDSFHDVYFGADFAQLQSLQNLDIDSNCRIGRLQNKSFDGLKSTCLQSIRIIHCTRLFNIEAVYVDEDDDSVHLAQCVEHLDVSMNQIRGNGLGLLGVLPRFKSLKSLRIQLVS
ncbi:insulin-like growth factor-binding protein complex acid labile subunit [Littorina saxatilis]|uniref:insulin-like growth factor-binding protein complex acid labile subunit n=1 Tax=Littorina saxatilis TaxID=31220 RepID=UPI0038B54196